MENESLFIYRNVFSAMTEGVMVFDADGQVVLCNSRATELLELENPLELDLQFFIRDMSGRYDQFSDAVFEALYNHDLRHNTTISYGASEGDHRYLVSTAFLQDENIDGNIMVVINDITSLEKLHETFGRYVSDEIANTILNSPDGLSMGGDEREVTILMSDLRGFTAMCERMKAEDIVSLLNHYFEAMNDCITQYGGTVIEFLGDGMLVVFGAPVASDDHATRAVAAAVSMQKAMADVNAWNEERGYPVLNMGIGINTGVTVVGNIGCEKRTKYGVLGSQVNLAGRIESYTVAGQILLSDATRCAVTEPLLIEQETDVFPKGVDSALRLVQIIGIGGSYKLSYELKRPPLRNLSTPYILTFKTLEGKHVSDENFLARITAVSDEQVLLVTDKELNVFDNIRMDLAGKTYGKVIKKSEDGLIVDLTALSDGYTLWLNAILTQEAK